mmetsp:Transcript_107425/g.300842  ORF Transcript_107425/g.300842 Transcript_107425/m.300842 type:complete len:400 (-) Transcript_107425:143-1342(-)
MSGPMAVGQPVLRKATQLRARQAKAEREPLSPPHSVEELQAELLADPQDHDHARHHDQTPATAALLVAELVQEHPVLEAGPFRHLGHDRLHGVVVRGEVKDPVQRGRGVGRRDDEAVEEHEDRHERHGDHLSLPHVLRDGADEGEQGVVHEEERQRPSEHVAEDVALQAAEGRHDHDVAQRPEQRQRHVHREDRQGGRVFGVQRLRRLVLHERALCDEGYQRHRACQAEHGDQAEDKCDLPQQLAPLADALEHVAHEEALNHGDDQRQGQRQRVPHGYADLPLQQGHDLCPKGDRVRAEPHEPVLVAHQHVWNALAHLLLGLLYAPLDHRPQVRVEGLDEEVALVEGRLRREEVEVEVRRVDVDRHWEASLPPERLRAGHSTAVGHPPRAGRQQDQAVE